MLQMLQQSKLGGYQHYQENCLFELETLKTTSAFYSLPHFNLPRKYVKLKYLIHLC